MSQVICLNNHSDSVKYLIRNDKQLAEVIKMVGDITYTPYDDSYSFIIETIVGQMLSNKVADILAGRLKNICNGDIAPYQISKLSIEELRSIGLSGAKSQYIQLITEEVINKRLDFSALPDLADRDVIKILTSFKGIGIWSAKMYLIFVLNRPDILPYEDGAFMQSYSWLYNTNDLNAKSIAAKCEKWKPYASIASRYLYRALDQGLTKTPFI